MVVLASIPERAEAPCEVPARLLLHVFTALPVVGKLAGVAEPAEPILKIPAQPPLLLRLGADARDRGGGRGSAGRRHIWQVERIRNLDSRVRSNRPFRFVCDHVQFTCDHVQFTATAARVLRSRPQSPPLSSSAATRPPWCLAPTASSCTACTRSLSLAVASAHLSLSLTLEFYGCSGWSA